MKREWQEAFFKEVCKKVCEQWESTGYRPIFEADVAGWILHAIIGHPKVSIPSVHLSPRICGGREKPDIVIGRIDEECSCIEPEVIAEIKIFSEFFGRQECQVHFKEAMEDICKLAKWVSQGIYCFKILVDAWGCGFLSRGGSKNKLCYLDRIRKRRDSICPSVKIFVISKVGAKWVVDVL